MANLLARRACQNLLRTRLASSLALQLPVAQQQQQRSIHATTVVQKKKAKGAAASASSSSSIFEGDLFGNPEDDLFAHLAFTPSPEPTVPSPQPPKGEPTSQSSTTAAPTTSKGKPKKTKLSPAERHQRFEAYLTYISPQLGRKPEVPNPRVKKRSLVTLLQLAQNEEEVGRVMELLPRWREAGREILPGLGEAFVRRCQELACPTLALTLFGNFAKYQVPLTLPAAQWLIHSLHLSAPLEQVMVATSLYPIYNLPSVSDDLASATMVAAACYRHGTDKSIRLAEELRPSVVRLLKEQKKLRESLEDEKKKKAGKPNAAVTTPTNTAEKRDARKILKWVAFSLHSLNKAAKKRTSRVYVQPELIPSGLRLGLVSSLLAASTAPAPGTSSSASSSSSSPSEAAAAAAGGAAQETQRGA